MSVTCHKALGVMKVLTMAAALSPTCFPLTSVLSSPALLRPLLGSVSALLLHGSLLLASFFLAGLTWAAMRGPLVSAWELWAVSLAARETAAAAPRPWTRGPAATSHSPLLQCQTPASLLFQKPATPGQVWRSPSRVQVVAKCHQADLMRHLKSAFLPDYHGHRCLGRRDKCPNWLPTRGLFLSQVTVPLCHSPSHMTSSIRNLQSLPRLPFVTARAQHPRPSLV